MLHTKPTEHLTGINFQGDYYCFYDLTDSIYRIVGIEPEADMEDSHYGVKNRLLALCYDIRHAYMGDREILLLDNDTEIEKLEQNQISKEPVNICYSVNILFPQAVFLALSVPELYYHSYRNYGDEETENEEQRATYIQYIRDKANLDVIIAGIWQSVEDVIGPEETKKLFLMNQNFNVDYSDYLTQYIDKCDIELLNTPFEKRSSKWKNIIKRLIKKPKTYYNMERDYKYCADNENVSIYELYDPRIDYPDEIIW